MEVLPGVVKYLFIFAACLRSVERAYDVVFKIPASGRGGLYKHPAPHVANVQRNQSLDLALHTSVWQNPYMLST